MDILFDPVIFQNPSIEQCYFLSGLPTAEMP